MNGVRSLSLGQVGKIFKVMLQNYDRGSFSPDESRSCLTEMSFLSSTMIKYTSNDDELARYIDPKLAYALSAWGRDDVSSTQLSEKLSRAGKRVWVKPVPRKLASENEVEQGKIGIQLIAEVPGLTDAVFLAGFSPLPYVAFVLRSFKPSVNVWVVETERAPQVVNGFQERTVRLTQDELASAEPVRFEFKDLPPDSTTLALFAGVMSLPLPANSEVAVLVPSANFEANFCNGKQGSG